ncbi:MAG: MBL fold metallo-hydrolase [Acidimicrobiales bacterium]|jgi:glyoxylase-like metal-dependent hydrolase (beta-lactamase superfamily II)
MTDRFITVPLAATPDRCHDSCGPPTLQLPEARPFPRDGALDLPGRPLPFSTPGHTSGHSCYHLPDAGPITTGDVLLSAHPTSGTSGPQLLMPLFDYDEAGTVASLDSLERREANTVLPCYGPLLRTPPRGVVAFERERAGS